MDEPRSNESRSAGDGGVALPCGTKAPVVVGGIGGSGTRVVAEMLQSAGFFLGTELNHALDNLWFTLLFKRPCILECPEEDFLRLVAVFVEGMVGEAEWSPQDLALIASTTTIPRRDHPVDWLRERADSLTTRSPARLRPGTAWGWKEPNSHVMLERLSRAIDGVKYVMVCRHGLDMALSQNQNQAHLWGPLLLREPCDGTPRYALRYWCVAHRRALSTAETMPGRFLLFNYDELCREPAATAASLCSFVGLDAAEAGRLSSGVRANETIGRHRQLGLDAFDADDVAYVESLGFDVGGR